MAAAEPEAVSEPTGGTLIADPEGRIEFADAGSCAALGCDSQADLVGSHLEQVFTPEDTEPGSGLLARVLRRGEGVEGVTARALDAAGRRPRVVLTLRPLGDGAEVRGAVVTCVSLDAAEPTPAPPDDRAPRAPFVEGLPGPFFAVDERERLLLWNGRLAEVRGGEDGELEGADPGAMFSEADGHRLRSGLRDAFREGHARIEAELLAADGTRCPYDLAAVRVVWGGRPVVAVFGVDVSDKRRMEQALRDSEQRFQTVFQQAALGIATVDGHGRLQLVNPELARFLGRDREELEGMRFHELTHPDDVGIDQRFFEELVRGERFSYQFDKRYLLPDGGVVWGRVHVTMLSKGARDAADEPMAALGIVEDITEQKRTADRLRRASIVFDSAHEGILVADAHGRLLDANPAFCDITGYARAELLGLELRDVLAGERGEDLARAVWPVLRDRGAWAGEVRSSRKDGGRTPQWLTVNAVTDEAGAISNYVGIVTDIGRLKDSQAELERLAHHDELTGLPNRLLFRDRLQQAVHRAQRSSLPVATLFVDLDGFKPVNDSLGHHAGDRLLQAVGERLTEVLRSSDTVARIGGDEFAIVLERLDAGDRAAQVAQRLIESLGRTFRIDGQDLHISASVGISLYPTDADDSSTLIRNADTAMYAAKQDGRNTYQLYRPEMTARASQQVVLRSRLHQAIQNDELLLHYQPQIDLLTGGWAGLETLVRWQDPSEGLVSPAQFVPIAEQSGLIIPLGKWVLRGACQQGRMWLDRGIPFGRIAVNVSGKQLQRGDLVEVVRQALEEFDFPGQCLELELTESSLVGRYDTAVRILHELREMGVSLAIDDFGTGYSCLAQLKRLPVDKLKIDKRFVQDLPDDENGAEIARTILAMGRALRLTVIAEGIEEDRQRRFLRDAGCEQAQGFLWQRPATAESIEAELAQR